MSELTGENVLVTGGCGSIGSQLVERILEQDPAVVRILDNDEEGLFDLQQRLAAAEAPRYLLGDVRDRDRLAMAIEGIDVVFHTAALKHVQINEYNPFEAIRTNVSGTQNLIRTAIEEEVDSFVSVSTDKASNPASVMGATKLLSERLTIAANTYKGNRDSRFGCVRFGNVVGSSGSVVPIFFEQIRAGGPVTVTDPEMTRFAMPVQSAAGLILDAHRRMASGEVFVLKMPALCIGTLAEAMIERYGPSAGYEPAAIETKIIGSRPGERVHEKLVSTDETRRARELEDMFVLLPQIDIKGYDEANYSDADPIGSEYTSEDERSLSETEIVELIEKSYPRGHRALDE
jgi:FlaA1/EpsC-like NDP-sugar epimerase